MPEAVKEVSEAPQAILKDDTSDKISCKEVKSVNIPTDTSPAEGLEEKVKAMEEDRPDNKSEDLKQEDTVGQLEKKEETEENGMSGNVGITVSEDKEQNKSDVPKEESISEVSKEESAGEVPKEENKNEVPKGENKNEIPKEENKNEVPKEENRSDVSKKEVGENGTTENKGESVSEASEQKKTTQDSSISVGNSQEVNNSKKSEKQLEESKDSSVEKVDLGNPNDTKTTEKPLEAKEISEEVKTVIADRNNDSMEVSLNSEDKISNTNDDNGSNDKCPEEKTMQNDVHQPDSVETIVNKKSLGEGMEVDDTIPSVPLVNKSNEDATVSVPNKAAEEVSCSNKDTKMEAEETTITCEENSAPVSSTELCKGTEEKTKDEKMAIDMSEEVCKKSDPSEVTTCPGGSVDEKVTENKKPSEDTSMEMATEGSWKESETDDIVLKPDETKIPSGVEVPEVTESGKPVEEIPQCTTLPTNEPAEKDVEFKPESKEISNKDKSTTSDEMEIVSTKVEGAFSSNAKETESPNIEVTNTKNEHLPINEEITPAPNTESIKESDIAHKKVGEKAAAGDEKLEKKETESNLVEEPSEGNVGSPKDVKVASKEGEGGEKSESSKPTLSNIDTNVEVDKSVEQNKQVESSGGSENVSVEAGRSTEIDPTKAEEVRALVNDARVALSGNDYFTAADLFGKACEIAGKLYGDLGHENAELYYSYGCAMLECAKNENTVLGEGVKESEDDKSNEDEEIEGDDADVNGDEEMEVDETEETTEESKNEEKENMENTTATGEGNNEGESTKEEEEEDTNLKVAWEMFELAKVIFNQTGNDLRLADTYMKLGEVGMESGHKDAIEDMKNALDLRKKNVPVNDRLLAETQFNIALAYGMFQQFDDAIEALHSSKSILQSRIENLKKDDSESAKLEIKEIGDLLPDLGEKIQDMKDSKEAKEKNVSNGEQQVPGVEIVADGASKPTVSNISHLVKRKRKLEDVTSDLLPNSKHPCTEKVSETTDPTEKSEN